MSKLDPKNNYRFPTEAEWEYAARGDTTTPWSSGSTEAELGESGWYSANAEGTTHAVAELKPNRFGLYDMYGNVCEWCDPTGPESGFFVVMRGGSWLFDARYLRSAGRNQYYHPEKRDRGVGGRPVRTPK